MCYKNKDCFCFFLFFLKLALSEIIHFLLMGLYSSIKEIDCWLMHGCMVVIGTCISLFIRTSLQRKNSSSVIPHPKLISFKFCVREHPTQDLTICTAFTRSDLVVNCFWMAKLWLKKSIWFKSYPRSAPYFSIVATIEK